MLTQEQESRFAEHLTDIDILAQHGTVILVGEQYGVEQGKYSILRLVNIGMKTVCWFPADPMRDPDPDSNELFLREHTFTQHLLAPGASVDMTPEQPTLSATVHFASRVSEEDDSAVLVSLVGQLGYGSVYYSLLQEHSASSLTDGGPVEGAASPQLPGSFVARREVGLPSL
ncbi:hypothetical protein DEDE109153_13130 [Deinococcus deserti]|uniref:Uncharacterized protein n=1 Tax=Deinococcus deserti (strain DSM 17065 / CIP 109153 / LMG 22923 / VCD115) TaxID=546414 RepID=C1CZ50_DEIDV|nr:hypothetical protein [Deinococcus deserti]ACO45088.1 Hypothetical protein Deide_02773 [Deinococcus deserti VCD115]